MEFQDWFKKVGAPSKSMIIHNQRTKNKGNDCPSHKTPEHKRWVLMSFYIFLRWIPMLPFDLSLKRTFFHQNDLSPESLTLEIQIEPRISSRVQCLRKKKLQGLNKLLDRRSLLYFNLKFQIECMLPMTYRNAWWSGKKQVNIFWV